jgi:uncharacterized membrane protein YtjA (UPF0391 family)
MGLVDTTSWYSAVSSIARTVFLLPTVWLLVVSLRNRGKDAGEQWSTRAVRIVFVVTGVLFVLTNELELATRLFDWVSKEH